LGHQHRPGLCPKRARVVALYTNPAPGTTTICTDELGPITPRTYPPAPGWSPDGHRIKAPLEYSRGPEKIWIYGALRVRDGWALTLSAPARDTAGHLRLLAAISAANPDGVLNVVMDNLSSHTSGPVRTWLADHPRLQQVPIPTGACWLNLQEGWWRLFRRAACAGQSFADADEIDQARATATQQLNARAKPWVWGRPPRAPRHFRRCFMYRL